METTISKDVFVEAINAVKAQHFHDLKCAASFSVVYPESFALLYDNNFLKHAIIDILEKGMCDEGEHSWIEYFIYDLEFGAKYTEGCVSINEGAPIDISTPELLWDFLVRSHTWPTLHG